MPIKTKSTPWNQSPTQLAAAAAVITVLLAAGATYNADGQYGGLLWPPALFGAIISKISAATGMSVKSAHRVSSDPGEGEASESNTSGHGYRIFRSIEEFVTALKEAKGIVAGLIDSEQCGHCTAMEGEWDKFASDVKKSKDLGYDVYRLKFPATDQDKFKMLEDVGIDPAQLGTPCFFICGMKKLVHKLEQIERTLPGIHSGFSKGLSMLEGIAGEMIEGSQGSKRRRKRKHRHKRKHKDEDEDESGSEDDEAPMATLGASGGYRIHAVQGPRPLDVDAPATEHTFTDGEMQAAACAEKLIPETRGFEDGIIIAPTQTQRRSVTFAMPEEGTPSPDDLSVSPPAQVPRDELAKTLMPAPGARAGDRSAAPDLDSRSGDYATASEGSDIGPMSLAPASAAGRKATPFSL